MEWFSLWWNGLKLVEQILYCIAIPASLILIIQTVIMLLGIGHGGEGFNPSDTSGFDGAEGGFPSTARQILIRIFLIMM